MRVMVVDDHALLRRGVCELFAGEFPGVEMVEAATGEDAVARVGDEPWDLIILDLAMDRRGGLDALKDIHTRRPEIPIIVLTFHEEEHYAIRALRGGARGFVTKRAAATELVRAARKAMTGARYLSDGLAEKLADAAFEPEKLPHEHLSDRELQVLRMLAIGKSVRQIGEDLALSEKTISTYRARLLAKMQLDSNAALMRYALRIGLVE